VKHGLEKPFKSLIFKRFFLFVKIINGKVCAVSDTINVVSVAFWVATGTGKLPSLSKFFVIFMGNLGNCCSGIGVLK